MNGYVTISSGRFSLAESNPCKTEGVKKVESIHGDFTGEVCGDVTKDSKFSKIKIGMSAKQVQDLIGQPTDTSSHATGKNWVPYYFGSDRSRTMYYYKDHGRLTFAKNGSRLFRIEVDSTEDGYY
ncbi:outer membrane protein assembly factor BamE [Neisseriaceae bacterium PsAf]|nr:outer membrane protein assembly factor BamE [Neisseriaceae bacterium PsAf]